MKIAVYLGSRPGRDPVYMDAAYEIGKYLAGRGVVISASIKSETLSPH